MRRSDVLFLVLLALVLANWIELKWLGPSPQVVPQNQECDSTSCPMPSNEQLFQREQQKQYLERPF